MLDVNQLSVEAGGRSILHDVSLHLNSGDTCIVFGPNGNGKTTLLMAIMGFPRYHITQGNIVFHDREITHLSLDERARMGIGMSFQRPPIVRGVKMRDMVNVSLGEHSFDGGEEGAVVVQLAEKANITALLDQDINYGFSGGEIKRSEMVQLLAQQPGLSLLDEPESGVDLVSVPLMGRLINELLEKHRHIRDRERMGIIISHTGRILDYVNARTGYLMLDGTIVCEGDPHEILETIKSRGYEECAKCMSEKSPTQ